MKRFIPQRFRDSNSPQLFLGLVLIIFVLIVIVVWRAVAKQDTKLTKHPVGGTAVATLGPR